MAGIDFDAVARKVRAAGRTVEQFVRDCFEAPVAVVVTPTPAGRVPVPTPNVRTTRVLGGVPGAPAADGPDTALVAILIALVRAAIQDSADDRALQIAALRAYNQGRGVLADRIESWEMSQEEGLQRLVNSLRSVFGQDARGALTAVLRQAERTFGWTAQTAGAARDRIADFVFRTTRAVMRSFGLAAQAAAPMLCQVAVTVVTIVLVIVVVVIAVFTLGAAGAAVVTAAGACATATSATIATALTVLIAAGIALGAVVGAGVRSLGRRAVDWAETVCDAWRRAAPRPALQQLVHALHVELGWTAEQVAAVVEKKCEVLLDWIADALIGDYGRDQAMLARALKAARAGYGTIASTLKSKLAAGASDIAQALKDAGADARAVAQALKDAGFSAKDAARALQSRFGADADAIARALRAASYSVGDVVSAIQEVCRLTHARALAILANIG